LNDGSNVYFNINSTILATANALNNLTVWINTTSGNQNSSSVSFSVDTIPPTISLNSPADGTANVGNIAFTYTVNEDANCSLIINNTINQSSIATIGSNTFVQYMNLGTYSWGINCTDSAGNENSSEIRTLTIKSSGGTIKNVEVVRNFTLTPNSLNIESIVNMTKEVKIIIKSKGNFRQNISSRLYGLDGIAKVDGDFLLNVGEEKTITLSLLSTEAGTFYGELIVSSYLGETKVVPITFTVKPKLPPIYAKIEIPEKNVSAGSSLGINVLVTTTEPETVSVRYTIIDMNGVIVKEDYQKFDVVDQKLFTKYLQIPNDLESGSYKIKIEINKITITDVFTVNKEKSETNIIYIYILIGFVVVVIGYLFWPVTKSYRRTHARLPI